jgi:hypothetical protein
MDASRLANCVARAANFLDENQLYNGEFRSYLANNEAMYGGCALVDSCIFVTSCILYSLSFLNDPALAAMKRAAFRFLIQEMKPPGIWKYFSSRYPTKIDADVDDTACASFLLKELHPDIRAGRNIEIILGNRNQDGLFFTWLRGTGEPNDVDSVVNANVLLYLGERKETEAVSEYLKAIVADRRESETYYYYLDDLALYYAISRAYFNGLYSLRAAKEHIISQIEGRQRGDGSFGNDLLTGLAVCSLLNYSCADLTVLGSGIENLMDAQLADGAWRRQAYYAGPPPPGPRAAWFGSEELTTGFCLEALVRFQALLR